MLSATYQNEVSPRKAAIRDLADRLAQERDTWVARNSFYYEDDRRYMRFLISEGLRVLDLGCGTGQLLATLKPSRGVGVDLSAKMISVARKSFPNLEFHVGDIEDPDTLSKLGGPFDIVVMSDTIGALEDCETTLSMLHRICTRDTRLIISYYNRLWGPIGRLFEKISLKMPQTGMNWLSTEDIAGLLYLADFEVVKKEWRQLIPKRILGIGSIVNRYIGTLPVVRRACLRNYLVARPNRDIALGKLSTTVVVPCRNERGNIENIVRRIPQLCDELEIIFVEGNSKDDTFDEIQRVIAAHPEQEIKVLQQDGIGKGDAVRKGFAHARNEVLMILDADLTMPPESLPKIYKALIEGKGNFINATRLVYPMESQAMRALNFLANRGFARIFSWLLNDRVTDTLCGTKALTRTHYQKIASARGYFGEFDPFGDFDLIFGASKLNLKIVEVPIRYGARTYGETQISRFVHGWLLLRMVFFAHRKLKAF